MRGSLPVQSLAHSGLALVASGAQDGQVRLAAAIRPAFIAGVIGSQLASAARGGDRAVERGEAGCFG